MREYSLKQVDAFTDEVFGGNPAGVVLDANGLSDREMQNIAREMNLSETAFILPSKNADFRIRWFTPEKEVLFCGHATIASLNCLAEEEKFNMNKNGKFTFKIETLVGILQVEVIKSDNVNEIILDAPKINLVNEKLDKVKIFEALKIDLNDIDDFHPIMRDKTLDYIYIALKKLSTLKSINYDYDKLKAFSREYMIKGFSLFTMETFDEDSVVHSRFFTPFYGITEDPVTGSAQGPLGVYLVLNELVNLYNNEVEIKSEQGDIMGRPGRLVIKVVKDGVDYNSKLIARAVTFFDGKILLK